MRLAAVEMSLRRVRMLVGEEAAGSLSILARDEALPPRAEVMGTTEHRRFLALLGTLRARAAALGAYRLSAVACGELARIRGIAILKELVSDHLGVDLIFPTPVEQRRLVFQGVASPMTGRLAVVHLGEDTTEVVMGVGRTILFEDTLPLRLASAERDPEHPASPGEHYARLMEAITSAAEPVARQIRAVRAEELVFATKPGTARDGFVLGALATLFGATRVRLVHRPLAEGLLACALAVAQTEAHSPHRDQRVRVADLTAQP
jgi:hypothetical protein